MHDSNTKNLNNKSAEEFLGNPSYPAISYGGYRELSREFQPSINEIKEDISLLHALGYRVIRTYDVHHKFAENTLEAIQQLRDEDSSFEMYVMLGTWIDCMDSFTEKPNHNEEDFESNQREVLEAVRLTIKYPEIVKIIAVGNESMVHWATSYFVLPSVILNWVNYLQELKIKGDLPSELWITSSDNFASWGGGDQAYHNDDLNTLIKAVDYISVHTYPFHDTYYNPSFWNIEEDIKFENDIDAINYAMQKSVDYAYSQFLNVKNYVAALGIEKQIHIGETGWASVATDLYGIDGTKAADEYKQSVYYTLTNELCNRLSISCFYFSAFDEPWKDSSNVYGSENHFGLFTVNGEAKYALWDRVDNNTFNGLGRNGIKVNKTFDGNMDDLLKTVKVPYINDLGEN